MGCRKFYYLFPLQFPFRKYAAEEYKVSPFAALLLLGKAAVAHALLKRMQSSLYPPMSSWHRVPFQAVAKISPVFYSYINVLQTINKKIFLGAAKSVGLV